MKRNYIRPAILVIETYPEGHICDVSKWQVGDDSRIDVIEGDPDDDGNFAPWPSSFTDN